MSSLESFEFLHISEDQISKVVKEICTRLTSRQIVFLEGDPGAGKTTLVNHLLRELGLVPSASPTFALHHQTKGFSLKGQSIIVDHFDLYRVDGIDELETTGIWEILNERQISGQHLIFIEWASRFDESIWPLGLSKMWIKITSPASDRNRNYCVRIESELPSEL